MKELTSMRSLLRFTILLIIFGYGWGLPKISLDGMDSAIQGKSISQHKLFQNLKGLRIAHGSIGYFFNTANLKKINFC